MLKFNYNLAHDAYLTYIYIYIYIKPIHIDDFLTRLYINNSIFNWQIKITLPSCFKDPYYICVHAHTCMCALAIYQGELGSPPQVASNPYGFLVTNWPCQIYYSLTGLVIRGNIWPHGQLKPQASPFRFFQFGDVCSSGNNHSQEYLAKIWQYSKIWK
jgi:hypothetical protein